eukprot:s701_g14.t1
MSAVCCLKSKLSNIRTSSRQSSRQTSFSRQITPGSDRLEKDLAVRSRLAAFWQPTACRISAMPNSTHSSHI